MRPIILVGFMGSGKTTVGKELASVLGCPFTDTDQVIENSEGVPVSQIFAEKGENYFRELEKDIVENLDDTHFEVIAVGGGLPCYNGLMDVLNKKGFTVYLKADEELLFERLWHEMEERPLIEGMGEHELKAFISRKLMEREPYYQQALITILSTESTVSDIIRQLPPHQKN